MLCAHTHCIAALVADWMKQRLGRRNAALLIFLDTADFIVTISEHTHSPDGKHEHVLKLAYSDVVSYITRTIKIIVLKETSS